MPPKRKFNPIRSRGRYRAPSPSPPRPQRPSVVNRWKNVKENRVKIIKSLQDNKTINYFYWSQAKHVAKISFLMNAHKISAEAAFYMYKEHHHSP